MNRKNAGRLPEKTGYSAPPKPVPEEFRDLRVALLATRWNAELVALLVDGAHRCLHDWGVGETHVETLYAPGAFELPLAAEVLMRRGRHDAIIALGAVIRGGTPHFDFVAGECARGLREAAQRHQVPLGFGVLTVDDARQAFERAGPGDDNKGFEATAAALEMVRLLRVVE